ncbi:glycosyltransferase involved in cell wall biosynthesis [Sediminihabitans luteus]|uniref:Glycosyltransferase involved in cell wall biosynthesis n=1 Tax=Sediminihabitans luteus TaxID=1138585 RepID=A0A2M9CQS7_9CELL|nr:glycosyltransferase family 29 protein [Sediminihabitans luteus]PJJ74198.1 glycosyltransferase involved in cell wall biosynthesis [Sediminihabitans luteus]GII99051.1 hypothetical protein Slu03_14290 [Sediminihabitans luteus]
MKRNLRDISVTRAAAWRLRVLAERLSGERRRPARRPGGSSDDLALTRAEWRDQGPTPALVERARSMSQNSVAWSVLPARLWLVFAGALVEAGEHEHAERIVRTWMRRRDDADTLALCLPVAQFARDLGIGARPVARAAAAADVLAANSDADVVGALVRHGSVAVVGNGPGNLGSGRGEEIDAHDLVVRFNNFPRGYEADYGSRTDVWVRGAHPDVRDRAGIEDFSLVLWEMDVFRNVLERPAHGEVLYRDTQFAPEKIAHVDTRTKAALRSRSGLLLPTSGAQLLWMLHESRGSLRDVDVYGFSTVDGTDEVGHYFDALGDMGTRHDVSGEGEFLRGLLAGVDLPGPASSAAGPGATSATDPDATDRDATDHDADGTVVVGWAYRQYDPANGKTGGPAGVLATQRLALGDDLDGRRLEYRFDDGGKAELAARLEVQLTGLSSKVADIVLGAEVVQCDPDVARWRAQGRTLLFVCHDLGTAYGAHLLGVPYVLVYHQQGSTVQEMRSNGRRPTAHEEHVAQRLERVVLENAQQVYFPSLGALETYRSTARIVDPGAIAFADRALHNTVSAVDHAEGQDRAAQRAAIRRELDIPDDDDVQVFVSVGDFNHDKGLDRVPDLLDRYVRLTGRKVLWVAVGGASDPALFGRLRAKQKKWRFDARLVGERMTHDKLLALLDLADHYVMLHRNAIFDLATLEAMRAGKALVLSPVGGNREVDKDSNVLFVTDETLDDACRVLETRDPVAWGERNRQVFDEHFSLGRFADSYRVMIEENLRALEPATSEPLAAVAS